MFAAALAPAGAGARKRVRTVAIAGPDARGGKRLRQYLRLVPSGGAAPRTSAGGATRGAEQVTPQNAVPLVQRRDPARFGLYCDLGL